MSPLHHITVSLSVPVPEPGPLRQRLVAVAKDSHLRGHIVITAQSVRVSLFGSPLQTDRLLQELQSQLGVSQLKVHQRPISHRPFARLVIRVIQANDGSITDTSEEIAVVETESQCPACLLSLTTPGRPNSQPSDAAEPLAPCPACGRDAQAGMAAGLDERHRRIRRAVTPLPGREPRDHFKPIKVPPECDGSTLLKAIGQVVVHLPESAWEEEFARGLLLNSLYEPCAAHQPVRAGECYWHKFPALIEPDVDGRVEVLHEDEALIIVNKPAPLPMHAGGRYFRNTLQHILNAAYHPQTPHPAHRLDAITTGLVLAARTPHFAGRLQPQFARRQVQKHYLVQVHGRPPADLFHCDAPIGSTSGELGSRDVDLAHGLPARTEFRVLLRNTDGTSILEAQPLTGRTHQIRVHLWHLGLPVCGDPIYWPENKLGQTSTIALGDPPLQLHAWRLRFRHPLTEQPAEFTAPLPSWAARLIFPSLPRASETPTKVSP